VLQGRRTARASLEAVTGSLARLPRATAAIVGIAFAYGIVTLLLPHPYPTYDEAKYLAIGHSSLDGLGPLTAFGDRFLPHAPFWPMLFAAPDAWAGLDPWTWGYLVNAASGVAVLLMAARFASRFGPLAAILTVTVLAGWVSLFGLTRTARLDVPEAALALAYLWVAMSAIETGLIRRGILAGILFSWSFLTKEASLVLLAAPFIAGIALRRPIGRIALAAGLVMLLTVPLTSWWFVWYADATGRIFALGLGRSVLVPLAIGLVLVSGILVLLGLGGGPLRRMRSRLDARLAHRPQALALASILLGAWVLAFVLGFWNADVQAGRTLADVGQLVRWTRTWASDLAGLALLGLGAVPALVAVFRGDDRPIEPLVAVIAGSPWLLLVAVLGEPPRNDIAELALLAAVGSGGWLMLGEALRGRDRATLVVAALVGAGLAIAADLLLARAGIAPRVTKSALGLGAAGILGAVAGAILARRGGRDLLQRLIGRSRPIARLGLPRLLADGRLLSVGLVAALSLGTAGVLSAHLALASPNLSRDFLAREVAGWLDENIPAGSTVMFGSVQANETAIVLEGRYRLRRLQATIGVTFPEAPLGIAVGGEPAPDVVVVDRHPRQHGFFVFTASMIRGKLDAALPSAIVYVTGINTATPSMVDWLASEPGVTLATTIESPAGGTPLVARIYRVDMTRIRVPSDRTYVSSAAITQLLDDLGDSPRTPSVASALLQRLVVTDEDPAGPATTRLRSEAAR
jgi:hypothetical protein